jgi:hypothetical protein
MSADALQLDFRRPPRSNWRWVGWVALALAVLATVLFSQRYAAVAARHALAEGRHDALEARLRDTGARRTVAAVDPKTLVDVRRANIVIDQLTVPWDGLFDAVERADARGLGVLALTPSARDRSIRLAGEAKSMEELLAYVDRMAQQPLLGQVHLQSVNTVAREGVPVVSFNLAATWRLQP